MTEASVLLAGVAGLIATLAAAFSGLLWLRQRATAARAAHRKPSGVPDDGDWEI